MQTVALILGGFALLISLVALYWSARLAEYMPTATKIAVWRTQTGDLEERMESLETRLRRLSSKYSMREKRAAGKMNGADPTTDAEEWKREMNRKLATGEAKVR